MSGWLWSWIGECAYLIDLSPPCLDAGNVEQNGAVLPKWALFNVVDESNGTEVHVTFPLPLNDAGLNHVAWIRCIRERSFHDNF